MDNITLSIIDTIRALIINEIGGLIYPAEKKTSEFTKQESPYIKFLPITVSIEFMGACYDELPFELTRLDKSDIVETRFNTALKKLFDKKYDQYSKAGSKYYL